MLTRTTSTTVPQEQQKPVLLPTYPQHIIEALTPRQLRATLAGQQYYSHFHGTSATQEQLGTAIERRKQQWQRNHASLEWQLHFMRGWNAGLLNDPADPRHGDPIAPVAGEPTGPTFGADDAPVIASTFGNGRAPEGGDGTGWTPIKCGESDSPVFGPDGGTEPGWSSLQCATSATPVFGPEDGDRPGWTRNHGDITRTGSRSTRHAPMLIDDDDEDYRMRFAPHEGDDDTWCCLKFRPVGGDDEMWHYARLTFGPESDDEPGERRPSANHDEIEYRRTRRRVIAQPTRLTFIPEDPTTDRPLFATGGETQHYSFGDDDDEQEEHGGWLRSHLPHYFAAQKGGDGTHLLTTASGYPLPIPLMGGDGYHFDDEKPDDDGWHHPRPHYSFTKARGTTQRPLLFGDDEWGRSAHPHAFLARKAMFTAALLA